MIGKEVFYSVEYNAPGSNKHYGCVYLKNGKYFTSKNLDTELKPELCVGVMAGGGGGGGGG